MAKKIFYALMIIVGVAILTNLVWLDYDWYHNRNYDPVELSAPADSTSECFDDLLFKSVDDVVEDHRIFTRMHYIDSVYLTIPEDILIQIANVVIGKQGSAQTAEIVKEYLKNYEEIYRYIPAPEEPVSTPIDTVKLPVTKDTVINGSNLKIVIE